MYDTYKMRDHICKELEKKEQTGIKNTTDLDTVWKLIDAYKNLLKIEMLEEAEEYKYNDGHSERRRRDSRGRYSRDDGYEHGDSYGRDGYSAARERYMDEKHAYRSTRSPESKKEMTVSLHDCMTKLKDELSDMMSSADTREERDKIREMIQEIGRLA